MLKGTPALILAAALALTGCASSGTTSPTLSYAATVGLIQTDWPQLEAVASIYTIANPGAAAGITAIEAKVTPLVAALSATSPPSSVSAILSDMNVIVATIPSCSPPPASQSGCISLRTKADLSAALAVIGLGQGLLATAAATS